MPLLIQYQLQQSEKLLLELGEVDRGEYLLPQLSHFKQINQLLKVLLYRLLLLLRPGLLLIKKIDKVVLFFILVALSTHLPPQLLGYLLVLRF